jgi:hypothetical protein
VQARSDIVLMEERIDCLTTTRKEGRGTVGLQWERRLELWMRGYGLLV